MGIMGRRGRGEAVRERGIDSQDDQDDQDDENKTLFTVWRRVGEEHSIEPTSSYRIITVKK